MRQTLSQSPINFCTDDFGPLEVDYDYAAVAEAISREKIEKRPRTCGATANCCRSTGEPTVGPQVGGTPLVKADRLADALGVERLWIKNDAVNFPTLSFKDRVVSVALSKAREFGFRTVGCASTGNLANSVAANAAAAGLESLHLRPLRPGAEPRSSAPASTAPRSSRVNGTYDEVNRLCTQVAFKYGWGFVNINLRPFYAEGSKTFGFEIAEDLGWRFPQHVVCPMAGGALIGKIYKAFDELHKVGLVEERRPRKMLRRPGHRLQSDHRRGEEPAGNATSRSRKPNTICKSLAIGDPADGYLRRQADARHRRLGRGRQRPGDHRRRCSCWPAPKAFSRRRPAA